MDTCPYRAIIQAMPLPFATFQVRKDSWILTAFNAAFQKLTDCTVGDAVDDFPFTIQDERSEIQLDAEWYLVYQFKFPPDMAVLFFHDITARRSFDSLLPEIMKQAAACI